jgi:HAMP domain-containing protein
MMTSPQSNSTDIALDAKPQRRISLQLALLVPFLLQIFGAVGITGYLSIQNGQRTVNDMATRLEKATSKQIGQQLDGYLPLVPKLSRVNAEAVRTGSLNLQNLTQIGQVFCTQMQNFPVGYAAFGTPQGDYIGVERLDNGKIVINEQSARTNGKLAVFPTTEKCDRGPMSEAKDDYNFFEESWYVETVKAQKPVWSSISNWDDKPEVMSVSYNAPLYGPDKKLQAVVGGDFIMTQLSQFLAKLEVSQNAKVFLMERSGALIASSTDQKPFTMEDGKAKRLNAEDSSDPVIREAAVQLNQKFEGFAGISEAADLTAKLQGQNHYLNVTPWTDSQGLDWLIVMAVPESDFLGAMEANTRQTILLCIVALIVATVCGLATSRWILEPILTLNKAADAVARGDEEVELPQSNITELHQVSASFNNMADRLRYVLSALQTDNQTLGAQVEEKNQALKEALTRIRGKQDHAVQKQREDRAKLANLSTQIGYPVSSMQTELDSAQANLTTILDELCNYREQIKQLPIELRQEISTADLDAMIVDLRKRTIVLEQGSQRIDSLSDHLKQHIQQIQQG